MRRSRPPLPPFGPPTMFLLLDFIWAQTLRREDPSRLLSLKAVVGGISKLAGSLLSRSSSLSLSLSLSLHEPVADYTVFSRLKKLERS